MQETYLKAFRAADQFQPGTNLRAWLFTILHNTARNRARDRARDTVAIDSANVRVAIANGIARFDTLAVDLPQGIVEAKGTFGLAPGRAGVARDDQRRPAGEVLYAFLRWSGTLSRLAAEATIGSAGTSSLV